MLKITVQEGAEAVAIKLEGRLGGPWIMELDQAWKAVGESLGTKKVSLDLCDMTYADVNGRKLLHEIYETCGASFVTSTPLSKHFAAEAMSTHSSKTKKERDDA